MNLPNIMSTRKTLPLLGAYGVLALISLVAVCLRFHNLKENGLSGSDTIYYTTIAKMWSDGDRVYCYPPGGGVQAYRPATYLLFAAAIDMLGYNDHAIKLANAALDSLNIVLLFLACYALSKRDVWPALAAAFLYAFLPQAISFSRVELAHVSSVFMVLLTLFFFVLAHRRKDSLKGYLLLLVSGCCVGMAALTHEELLLLGPGYILFLWVDKDHWGSPRSIGVASGVFGAGTLLSSYGMILATLANPSPLEGAADRWERILNLPETTARLVWNGIVVNGSASLLYLFLLILFLAFARRAQGMVSRRRRPVFRARLLYLPLMVSLVYAVGCAFYLGSYPPRAFFAVFPLLLLFIVLWYAEASKQHLSPPLARLVLISATFVLVPLNIGNYAGPGTRRAARFSASWTPAILSNDLEVRQGARMLMQEIRAKSWARMIYEELKDDVGKDAKLLVAPSILYPWPGRRALQVPYYFGDDAVYLIDHAEPLNELLARIPVKYILFARVHIEKSMVGRKFYTKYAYAGRWKPAERLHLGASCGLSAGQYTIDEEYRCLMSYLRERGASVVIASGLYASRSARRTESYSHLSSYVVYKIPTKRQ